MDGRRSSNAWKYLMVIAIVTVATAPIIVSVKKGGITRFNPAKTAVADWMAGATPTPTEIPEPTPDCCRGSGHDWMPTDSKVTGMGGCNGVLPVARCRNCKLWRSER